MDSTKQSKSPALDTKLLLEGFRDKDAILALKREIHAIAKDLPKPLYMMEVCGGHTHTLMRYGLNQLLPESIQCIHGWLPCMHNAKKSHQPSLHHCYAK